MTAILLPLLVLALIGGLVWWGWLRFLAAFQIELEPNRPMPALHDIPYETWHIPTGNHKLINGWMLLQPGQPNAPVVLVAHGWTRNASFLFPISHRIWKEGYQVFAINARNHGECDLDPPMSVLKYTEDMEHAIRWIRHRFPDSPIAMVGHSLGGAALLIASSRTPGIRAAVTLCAFSRSDEIFKMDIRRNRIPMWPVGRLLLWMIRLHLGKPYPALAPAEWVKQSATPTLLIAGENDTRIPDWMQTELKNAFPAGLAEGPVIIPNSSHTSLLTETVTMNIIVRFLNRHLRGTEPVPIVTEINSGNTA